MRRNGEKFSAARPALTRESSSLKTTSKTQWQEFSTAQCPRTASANFPASTGRLLR